MELIPENTVPLLCGLVLVGFRPLKLTLGIGHDDLRLIPECPLLLGSAFLWDYTSCVCVCVCACVCARERAVSLSYILNMHIVGFILFFILLPIC